MAVILTILKIIGIVLLVILGILLLLLLLVLFVPIRYSLSGDYMQEKEPHAEAAVRYLFPVVSVKVRLNPPVDAKKAGAGSGGQAAINSGVEDTEGHKPSKIRLEGGVRILGIRIINFFPTEEEKEKARIKKEKKLAKKAKKAQKRGDDTQIAELEAELLEERKEAQAGAAAESADTGKADGDQTNAGSADTDGADESRAGSDGTGEANEDADAKEKKERKPLLETIRLIALAMPDNVAKALDKLCELMEKMDRVPDLLYEKSEALKAKFRKGMRLYRRILWVWDKDYTQRALKKIKKVSVRILRSICPKKGQVKIAAGMDDIATTGQIAGYYGMLYGMFYPFIGKRVVLEPDFENKRLEADGFLKGRIRLYIFVPAAWLYFIDKDVKNLKKAVKIVQDEMH
ncbi:MAG: DUF2953 domain-containing protein [Lachnospiraceae bacterium]|nr:DUF2953 domain-containing protein [Lachnospiraceae bacterium]